MDTHCRGIVASFGNATLRMSVLLEESILLSRKTLRPLSMEARFGLLDKSALNSSHRHDTCWGAPRPPGGGSYMEQHKAHSEEF